MLVSHRAYDKIRREKRQKSTRRDLDSGPSSDESVRLHNKMYQSELKIVVSDRDTTVVDMKFHVANKGFPVADSPFSRHRWCFSRHRQRFRLFPMAFSQRRQTFHIGDMLFPSPMAVSNISKNTQKLEEKGTQLMRVLIPINRWQSTGRAWVYIMELTNHIAEIQVRSCQLKVMENFLTCFLTN